MRQISYSGLISVFLVLLIFGAGCGSSGHPKTIPLGSTALESGRLIVSLKQAPLNRIDGDVTQLVIQVFSIEGELLAEQAISAQSAVVEELPIGPVVARLIGVTPEGEIGYFDRVVQLSGGDNEVLFETLIFGDLPAIGSFEYESEVPALIAFTSQPRDVVSGASQPVEVAIYDNLGAPVSAVVLMTLTLDDATLESPATVTTSVDGSASFDLIVSGSSRSAVVRLQAPDLPESRSRQFEVSAAPDTPEPVARVWRTVHSALNLFGVAEGAGGYLTVGNRGLFRFISATEKDVYGFIGADVNLSDVVFAEGKFVAVGSSGFVGSSSDGKTWSQVADLETEAINSIRYDSQSGRFLISMRSGMVAFSEDAQIWNEFSVGALRDLNSIERANDLYLVVGELRSIFTSVNGTDWTARSGVGSLANAVEDITYGAGLFVAVGGSGTIQSSSDGEIWNLESSGTGQSLNAITLSADGLIAVGGGGTVVNSSDGRAWHPTNVGSIYQLQDVIFDGLNYVAVGQNNLVARSTDGVSWTSESASFVSDFVSVTSGNGLYVAGTNSNSLLYSADGSIWSKASVTNLTPRSGVTAGVTFDGTEFLAVNSFGEVVTSEDADLWTKRLDVDASFQSVTTGNGAVVVVGGDGAIYLTEDKIEWLKATSGTTADLRSVVHDGSRFLVVGTDGTMLQSLDGFDWSEVPGPFSGILNGVAFDGEGSYVVSSREGKLFHSSDLSNWTQTFDSDTVFAQVRFVDGKFFALGVSRAFYSSEDGIIWEKVEGEFASVELRDITDGHQGATVVGRDGIVLQLQSR